MAGGWIVFFIISYRLSCTRLFFYQYSPLLLILQALNLKIFFKQKL